MDSRSVVWVLIAFGVYLTGMIVIGAKYAKISSVFIVIFFLVYTASALAAGDEI